VRKSPSKVEKVVGWLGGRGEESRRKILERARIRTTGRANCERRKRSKGEEVGV